MEHQQETDGQSVHEVLAIDYYNEQYSGGGRELPSNRDDWGSAEEMVIDAFKAGWEAKEEWDSEQKPSGDLIPDLQAQLRSKGMLFGNDPDEDGTYEIAKVCAAICQREIEASKDRWISVKDRLPERGSFCDLWDNDFKFRRCDFEYEGDGVFYNSTWDHTHEVSVGRITHYQIVPSPPKSNPS